MTKVEPGIAGFVFACTGVTATVMAYHAVVRYGHVAVVVGSWALVLAGLAAWYAALRHASDRAILRSVQAVTVGTIAVLLLKRYFWP